MSTDRELLELAAKAFWGEEIDDVCSVRWLEEEQAIGYTHAENQDHNGIDQEFVWNPLEDDGDALRLAVSMNMGISIYDVQVTAASAFGMPVKEHDKDTAKATRRAIVRAAAEIGRAIP